MSTLRLARTVVLLLMCAASLARSQTTDTIGGTGYLAQYDNYVLWYPINASSSGCLQTLGAFIGNDGNIRLAIYSDKNGTPGSLLAQTADTMMARSNFWQDMPVAPANAVITTGTQYWLAAQIFSSGPTSYLWYGGSSTIHYYLSQPYGPFPGTASGAALGGGPDAYLRMTYSSTGACTSELILSPPVVQSPGPVACSSVFPPIFTLPLTLDLGACIGEDGNMMLALYADNNGEPGLLIAQTTDTPMSRGNFWQDLPVVPPGVTLIPGAKYWVAVEVISSGPNSYLWYGGPITEYYYLSQPYGSFPPTAAGLGLGYGPNAYLRMTYSPNISTTPAKMSTIGGASYLAEHDNYIFWYPITAPTFP